MQGTMKAARFYGARGPQGKQEVVRVEETPIPDIDQNEVLIRVRFGSSGGSMNVDVPPILTRPSFGHDAR